MTIPNDSQEERRDTDPGQLDTYPRKFTETWDTERGPAEVEVTEYMHDAGDGNGPQPVQWRSAPGWVFFPDHKSEFIGDVVDPGLSQGLNVSVSWHGSDASVDVMVFGENESNPDDKTLYEKGGFRFPVTGPARQFARLLLDASDRAEALPGGERQPAEAPSLS